jgi:hypothetical protein
MGVAHHSQRPIFGSMLGLGRTASRTGSAAFGCRLSPTGRVRRHPEPLIPFDDTIERFPVVVGIDGGGAIDQKPPMSNSATRVIWGNR